MVVVEPSSVHPVAVHCKVEKGSVLLSQIPELDVTVVASRQQVVLQNPSRQGVHEEKVDKVSNFVVCVSE